MGDFEQAIREHLELKRRHGAPRDEVEELEREVFGAARQRPARPPGMGQGNVRIIPRAQPPAHHVGH